MIRNPHPGETILEDFLKPWCRTPYWLAKQIGVTPARVSEILRGKRAITADTALRLSAVIGCSPEFWLGLQMSHDLREAEQRLAPELAKLQRYEHEGPIYLDGEAVEPTTSPPHHLTLPPTPASR